MAVRYRKMAREGAGFVLTLGSGSRAGGGGGGGGGGVVEGDIWALLCHTNTMLKRVQSLQNIKIPPAVLSCNIHVDTIETTMSSFFKRVFHVQSGSERVRDQGWV